MMNEGKRLSYIVPGYTGHIPKKFSDDFVMIEKEKPRYQIPGYAGYVKAIKSQNIHAKTFGKITYNISDQNYIKGQDIQPQQKFYSTNSDTFIAPTNMLQRTAADIVGIPNKKIQIHQPIPLETNAQFWGVNKTSPEIDQFTQTKNWPKKDIKEYKYENYNMANSAQKFYGTPQEKHYIPLEQPLPGYTGFNKRVTAGNIFGQTYTNARKTAKNQQQKLIFTKTNTFTSQLKKDPQIRH